MTTPVTPLRPHGPALRRATWPGSEMRVGDAERSAIADRLAQHFSDGRLDESEFNERLDQAMRAKTMGDLTGLLADLPETEPAEPPLQPPPGGSRRHQHRMLKMQLERERLRLRHARRTQRRAERRQRLHSLRWIPLLAGGIILVAIAVHWLTHSVVAWVLLALIAFLWLKSRDSICRGR